MVCRVLLGLLSTMSFIRLVQVAAALLLSFTQSITSEKPHILFVLVDDLGWSDVGFHGSKIRTPNIDKLASEGVILDNYYVQPICSPTRSALMSGRYPIHTGLQHGVIHGRAPYGLPLNFTLLPEKLKEAGYATHMVGKWHLGFFKWAYTPTYRGFDTFFGHYTGVEDHFTHEHEDILDLRNNKEPVRDMNGTYSAHVFSKQAEKIVSEHDPSKPLFLYLPFQNVHSPVQAPQAYIDKYKFIKDLKRRTYAAMVDAVDEAIGNVTRAFEEKGLWENTLMVFSTDNGGIPGGGGYDWPLRGHKGTLWEGGVRGIAFVHGPLLKRSGVICKELLHVTDWYPTLVSVAGANMECSRNTDVPPMDGVNVWETISQGQPSPRTEILHNIDLPMSDKDDGRRRREGVALRMGHMKILMSVENMTWYKPPELQEISFRDDENQMKRTIIDVALFNITADPDEHFDLSKKLPDIVKLMKSRVEFYKNGTVPQINKPNDPEAMQTAEKNGIWTPWRE